MTGHEALLIIGGILIGFALTDSWYQLRRTPPKPPRTVADGWDQIRHVRIIRGGGER